MRAQKQLLAITLCLGTLPAHGAGAPSPDQVLERHYDNYLTAEMPFLAHGLERIGRDDIPVGASAYEPYVKTTTRSFESGRTEILGQTVTGSRYRVIINTRGHRGWMRFLRNGVEEYRLDIKYLRDGHKLSRIESSLRYLDDPSRTIEISVEPLASAKAGQSRAAQLTVEVNGRSFSEKIWPGKKRLNNLSDLKSALARRDTRTIPLHNYFSLMVNSPSMVSRGLQVLDETLRGSGPRVRAAKSRQSVKDINGSEGYWCALGSAGADLVSGGIASFGYGVVCGAIAEASEE